jgi:hypothetical protein
MRKIQFLILSIGLLLSTGAFSQGLFNLAAGPRVGANYSYLTTPTAVLRGEPALGYHAGLYGRVGLGRFYVQPEALYGVKSGRIRIGDVVGQDLGSVVEERVDLNNVDVPLLLGFKIINQTGFNLRLSGGPVANFILNTNERQLSNFLPELGDFSGATWSMMAGVGADLGDFTLDVRYEFGLTDVNQSYGIRAQILQVSLGYNLLALFTPGFVR